MRDPADMTREEIEAKALRWRRIVGGLDRSLQHP